MAAKPGSMGVVAPGFEMAFVDESGNELPSGDEGEVAIRVRPERPVGLFDGYWNNPEANANSFRGDWYFTGDRASQDDDGYFWFVGRADDVIISASYRIGPFEVESALADHEAVAETAVVASPRPGSRQYRQGLRRPRPRPPALGRARKGHTGPRQAGHCAVQVPARDRVHRRAAQDHQREDPPHRAPRPRDRKEGRGELRH